MRRFGTALVAPGLSHLGVGLLCWVTLGAAGCDGSGSGAPEGGGAGGDQGGKVATGGTSSSGGATGGTSSGGTTSSAGTTSSGGVAPGGNAPTSGGGGAGSKATGGAAAGGNADGGAATNRGGAGGTGLGGGKASGGAAGGASGALGSSDEFDGTSLASTWTVFRGDLVDIEVANGAVALTPHAKALWYQSSQGPLIHKTMTGDFKVTATVHARKASNRNLTPMEFADVGGLMARSPSGSSENYVLGVVGYAEMNQLAIEHKSTTNSSSQYGETAFSADAELRLCRVGSTFTIYYRHPGDTGWPNSVAPISRADLPATLQVGMIAYTGAPSPDYVSIFDRIAFEPVGAGCYQ